MSTANKFVLPDTFWRISVKALVFDKDERLLVFMDNKGKWEIPGGGWEHSETLEQCIRRELEEEVDASVAHIEGLAFCYKGRYKYRGDHNPKLYPKMNIAVKVNLTNNKALRPKGDDLIELKYVSKEELLKLTMQRGEETIKEHVDEIWPSK